VRSVYEALYPAQTTQYVALLLVPGLIDELQGDVRAENIAYIIDQRLPVLVREYVNDAPLCSQVQERQIMAVIEMPTGYAIDVCRPVKRENEQAVVSWLTAALQKGFNAPEPDIQGIIYPQRVETQERMVYTRFAQYARYSAILAIVLLGVVVGMTAMRWHASMRWLGMICIATGILGVSLRAVTESGQAFDGALMLQQYSRQAAWSGLPLGVLIRVLADPSFRDWSIISACIVLFAGTPAITSTDAGGDTEPDGRGPQCRFPAFIESDRSGLDCNGDGCVTGWFGNQPTRNHPRRRITNQKSLIDVGVCHRHHGQHGLERRGILAFCKKGDIQRRQIPERR